MNHCKLSHKNDKYDPKDPDIPSLVGKNQERDDQIGRRILYVKEAHHTYQGRRKPFQIYWVGLKIFSCQHIQGSSSRE